MKTKTKNGRVELSMAIPFYNEEDNVQKVIKNVLRSLKEADFSYQIIAIDNGSRDKTGKIIDELVEKNKTIKKITVPINQGYGYGILNGLAQYQGQYLGFMWGDGQIDPSTIIKVFNKMKKKRAYLGKITRIRRTESLARRLQSFIYNSLMFLFFGINSEDMNGCPKIMPAHIFRNLKLKSKDWFLDAEIMIKCRKKRLKIIEVPTKSHDRKGGKSNVDWRTGFEFFKNILRYRFS